MKIKNFWMMMNVKYYKKNLKMLKKYYLLVLLFVFKVDKTFNAEKKEETKKVIGSASFNLKEIKDPVGRFEFRLGRLMDIFCFVEYKDFPKKNEPEVNIPITMYNLSYDNNNNVYFWRNDDENKMSELIKKHKKINIELPLWLFVNPNWLLKKPGEIIIFAYNENLNFEKVMTTYSLTLDNSFIELNNMLEKERKHDRYDDRIPCSIQ